MLLSLHTPPPSPPLSHVMRHRFSLLKIFHYWRISGLLLHLVSFYVLLNVIFTCMNCPTPKIAENSISQIPGSWGAVNYCYLSYNCTVFELLYELCDVYRINVYLHIVDLQYRYPLPFPPHRGPHM